MISEAIVNPSEIGDRIAKPNDSKEVTMSTKQTPTTAHLSRIAAHNRCLLTRSQILLVASLSLRFLGLVT